MASGSSVYPVGTWKNNPPPRLTNLATTRLGAGFGTTGTSFIVPSVFGSYANTCPGFAFGSRIRCLSSTVNVFIRGNSHQTRFVSSYFLPAAPKTKLNEQNRCFEPLARRFCGRICGSLACQIVFQSFSRRYSAVRPVSMSAEHMSSFAGGVHVHNCQRLRKEL